MSIAGYILVPATKVLYILTAFGSFGTHGIGSVAKSFLLGFGGTSKRGFCSSDMFGYCRLSVTDRKSNRGGPNTCARIHFLMGVWVPCCATSTLDPRAG